MAPLGHLPRTVAPQPRAIASSAVVSPKRVYESHGCDEDGASPRDRTRRWETNEKEDPRAGRREGPRRARARGGPTKG